MKNLFIIKAISENMDISDEAFTVWCGLRNIMVFENVTEYFVTLTMIAHSVFNRVPNRYELAAIKKGYQELVAKEYVKELMEFNKTDHLLDLSQLYYTKGKGYFSDLRAEEMHKIMNIEGNHNKYKLLRYFTAQVGSFNKSKDFAYYGGKVGGMGLDYFSNLIPITKPTCIAFNEILEQNELLFVIRHKDFYSFVGEKGQELREMPNTYSRWEDQEQAKSYAAITHGYKWQADQKNKKTAAANKKRSLGQKLNRLMNGYEYDLETIKELKTYAEERNKQTKKYEDREKAKGFNPFVFYFDMTKFDDYLPEMNEEYWGE